MPALPPSGTMASSPHLFARQNDDSSPSFTAVPTAYKNVDDSLVPGVVAGIVLGSVAGFLLLLYLIYMLLHRGPVVAPVDGSSTVVTSATPMSTVTGDTSTYLSFRSRRDRRQQHRSRSRATSKSKRTRSRATTERSSRDRSRRRTSPLVGQGHAERIIVDPPAPPRFPGSVVSSDNEIVVEEEHSVSPPRRSHSRRYSQDRYRRDPLVDSRGSRDYSPRDYSPRRGGSRRYSRDR
ncbi:hypothetical protein F66182_5589 [Fusarium sp. NRRL 66182]|nr:hypothetical protein F66182_5589 [Fusarium sp. NRRL 66182]